MFEDSTFASTNSIRVRSRAGFLVAVAFESALLLAMVLIPLLYPQALPSFVHSIMMEAPPAPVAEIRTQPRPAGGPVTPTMVAVQSIQAPTKIPSRIFYRNTPENSGSFNPGDLLSDGRPGNGIDPFGPAGPAVVVVHPAAPRSVRLPSVVVEGMLVHKTIPIYPQIAIGTHTQGTVVLEATISRQGVIQNLRVVSGPALLQQAALSAVSSWRYRPYMLNGQTIEVETTVNVVFKIE